LKLFLATLTFLAILSPLLEVMGESPHSCEPVRIEGLVTYDGRLPKPIPVNEADTSRQLIEVDPKTKGLKDAVVWLEGIREPAAHQNVAEQPVVMDLSAAAKRGAIFAESLDPFRDRSIAALASPFFISPHPWQA